MPPWSKPSREVMGPAGEKKALGMVVKGACWLSLSCARQVVTAATPVSWSVALAEVISALAHSIRVPEGTETLTVPSRALAGAGWPIARNHSVARSMW